MRRRCSNAFSRAVATARRAMSTAVTRAPSRAACRARAPLPVPTSRTSVPGVMPSRFRAATSSRVSCWGAYTPGSVIRGRARGAWARSADICDSVRRSGGEGTDPGGGSDLPVRQHPVPEPFLEVGGGGDAERDVRRHRGFVVEQTADHVAAHDLFVHRVGLDVLGVEELGRGAGAVALHGVGEAPRTGGRGDLDGGEVAYQGPAQPAVQTEQRHHVHQRQHGGTALVQIAAVRGVETQIAHETGEQPRVDAVRATGAELVVLDRRHPRLRPPAEPGQHPGMRVGLLEVVQRTLYRVLPQMPQLAAVLEEPGDTGTADWFHQETL